jgi:hypothetical protein
MVVQTAAQGMLAVAPEIMRRIVSVSRRETPGVELVARFDVMASPLALNGIYARFRNSRPVSEFRRRLKRQEKAKRKPPKEA